MAFVASGTLDLLDVSGGDSRAKLSVVRAVCRAVGIEGDTQVKIDQRRRFEVCSDPSDVGSVDAVSRSKNVASMALCDSGSQIVADSRK